MSVRSFTLSLNISEKNAASSRFILPIFAHEIGRGKIFLEQFALQWRPFGLGSAGTEENCSIHHKKPFRSYRFECRRNVPHAGSVPDIIPAAGTYDCWCAPRIGRSSATAVWD